MPTGGGKTLTAVYWLLQNAVDKGKKILWIAHRHLLLEQAADTFINNAYTNIMINHTSFRCRIISGMHDKPIHIKNDDNILIVSKDSINRSLERLDKWLKNEDVFLVIDEAHHAVAKTYRKTIADDVLPEMTDYCMEQYFDEDLVSACQRSDVEHLLLFYAQKAVDPLFVPLDDIVRKKLDVSEIAKKFEEEAMTGRERKAYLDSLWNAEDSVYKIYYSSPYIFKRMIDIEMDKLDGYMETDYAAPQTKAELRELEDLPLEEIINRYPNVGIPLKMRVFDKARNADGNYVCASCKKVFSNRKDLQVDHIKPMAKGGRTVESNLQILCRFCNQRKGDK